jgi:tRNA threonylcarbamoyladenosine biosynthesis protein TsaB
VLILSLDTTTRAGSAAVLQDDAVLAVAAGDAARTHGERLPAELEAVLRQANVALAQVDLLAVARGPGAFTGLRIGMAAMQGLAMVTGKPVVGISALEALAVGAFAQSGTPAARVGVWMDAARGEVFAAAYDAAGPPGGLPTLTLLSDPEVDAPAEVLARWRARLSAPDPDGAPGAGSAAWLFTGDGVASYRPLLGDVPVTVPAPLAPAIARLGRRLAAAGGSHPPHDLQPLYVRRPDAERPVRS